MATSNVIEWLFRMDSWSIAGGILNGMEIFCLGVREVLLARERRQIRSSVFLLKPALRGRKRLKNVFSLPGIPSVVAGETYHFTAFPARY